jgi:hypothetical protein
MRKLIVFGYDVIIENNDRVRIAKADGSRLTNNYPEAGRNIFAYLVDEGFLQADDSDMLRISRINGT